MVPRLARCLLFRRCLGAVRPITTTLERGQTPVRGSTTPRKTMMAVSGHLSPNILVLYYAAPILTDRFATFRVVSARTILAAQK